MAPTTPIQSSSDAVDFGRQIADAITQGIAKAAPRQKQPFGQYDPKTPFHPSKSSLKLSRATTQNGFPLMEERLHDEEIALLNAIDTPGRYVEKMVEVVIRENGSETSLDIRYKNQTADQRSELKSFVRNFREMLKWILVEQDAIKVQEGPKKNFGLTSEEIQARMATIKVGK